MPSLIRLKGDAETDNELIRNNFNDDIIIPPYGKVAVRNVYADILTSANQETFQITASMGYDYTVGLATTSIELDAAVYTSINNLLSDMQKVANSTIYTTGGGNPLDDTIGIYNALSYKNSKVQLEVYKADQSTAGFDTDWVFSDNSSSDFTQLLDNEVRSAGVNEVKGTLPFLTPLAHNSWTSTVYDTTAASFYLSPWYDDLRTYGAYLNDTPSRWELLIDGAVADTGTSTPEPLDRVTLLKFGQKLRLTIDSSAGILKEVLEGDIPDAVINNDTYFWNIEIPAGSTNGFSDVTIYTLPSLDPTTLQSSAVAVDLTFSDFQIANFLGFNGLDHKFSGNPATLEADNAPEGLLEFPGVMLVLDGIPTKSYIGVTRKAPSASTDYRNTQFLNNNIAGVVDIISVDSNQTKLRYQPNYPLFLDINNAYPLSLREVTCRFVRDDNNRNLQFIGSPVIVFEISE